MAVGEWIVFSRGLTCSAGVSTSISWERWREWHLLLHYSSNCEENLPMELPIGFNNVHPGISFSCQCEDGVVRNIQSLIYVDGTSQPRDLNHLKATLENTEMGQIDGSPEMGGFVEMVGGWPLASPQSPVPFPASLSWEEPSRQALVRLWDLEKWHFYNISLKMLPGRCSKYIGFFSLTISSSFPICFQFKEDCPFQKGNRQSSKCHRYDRYICVKIFGGLRVTLCTSDAG